MHRTTESTLGIRVVSNRQWHHFGSTNPVEQSFGARFLVRKTVPNPGEEASDSLFLSNFWTDLLRVCLSHSIAGSWHNFATDTARHLSSDVELVVPVEPLSKPSFPLLKSKLRAVLSWNISDEFRCSLQGRLHATLPMVKAVRLRDLDDALPLDDRIVSSNFVRGFQPNGIGPRMHGAVLGGGVFGTIAALVTLREPIYRGETAVCRLHSFVQGATNSTWADIRRCIPHGRVTAGFGISISASTASSLEVSLCLPLSQPGPGDRLMPLHISFEANLL